MRRGGFSLLEVILALAVLAGAIAVLGEACRMALRNAQATRDLVHAQLLCESKLAEITSGITPAQAVQKTAFDATSTASLESGDPAWLYSIETGSTDENGLISVRVTVTRDLPAVQHPVQFSLVRWLPDPNATSSSSSQQNAGSNGSSSSSSSGSSNASSSSTR
jgi:type II secretion system protein I